MPTQRCTRHTDRETRRICGRCERPFCPDCLVPTPVGGRCQECARGPAIARMKVQPWRWPVIAIVVLLGSVIVETVVGSLPIFGLILAYLAGQVLAGIALNLSGRRPGQALMVVTVVFIVIGVFLADPVYWALAALREPAEYGPAGEQFLAGGRDALLNIWHWASAALMAWGASTRLR